MNIFRHSATGAGAPPPRAAALVALAAILPYLATLRYGFVYDDVVFIVENDALHGPSGLLAAWHVPYWPSSMGAAGIYRPVVQWMYALLWNLGGGAAWPFHVCTIALHAACAVAFLWLLARALPPRAALLGALLFAVHPVHVEVVANIVGSVDTLAALASFALLAVLANAAAARDGDIPWAPALGAALLYAIAIGAKESAATLPALGAVFIWGWRTPGDRDGPSLWQVIRRGWRAWTACTVALLLMLAARAAVLHDLAPPQSALAFGLRGAGFAHRLWTMTAAWPLVGGLLFWPASMSMYYGTTVVTPHDAVSMSAALSIAVVLGAFAAASWFAARGDRRPLTALAWIALAYLAASNILVPTGVLLADRMLFFPSAGAVMLIAWAIARADDRIPNARPIVTALVLGVAAAGAVRSTLRASVWASGETLFLSGISYDPAAFYPYQQLARWYGRQGDDARAMAYLAKAYALYPEGEPLALEYAEHLRMDGRGEEALAVLRAAAAAHPMSQPARVAYLELLLVQRGPDSVIRAIEGSPAPDPAGSLRYTLLARAYRQRWGVDSVPPVYARGAAAAPRDPAMRFQYATALHAAHRDGEARAELDTAIMLGGVPPLARSVLAARIALALGDTAAARREIAVARGIAPADTALQRLEESLAGPKR